jgi:hypothetical protein
MKEVAGGYSQMTGSSTCGVSRRVPLARLVQKRLADFTIRCFLQPLEAPTHAAHKLPRSYIASVKPGYPAKAVFDQFAARARREGWLYHELLTGHDAQAEMPAALGELLLKIPVE